MKIGRRFSTVLEVHLPAMMVGIWSGWFMVSTARLERVKPERDGRTEFACFLAGKVKLAHSFPLDPMCNPDKRREPSV